MVPRSWPRAFSFFTLSSANRRAPTTVFFFFFPSSPSPSRHFTRANEIELARGEDGRFVTRIINSLALLHLVSILAWRKCRPKKERNETRGIFPFLSRVARDESEIEYHLAHSIFTNVENRAENTRVFFLQVASPCRSARSSYSSRVMRMAVKRKGCIIIRTKPDLYHPPSPDVTVNSFSTGSQPVAMYRNQDITREAAAPPLPLPRILPFIRSSAIRFSFSSAVFFLPPPPIRKEFVITRRIVRGETGSTFTRNHATEKLAQ